MYKATDALTKACCAPGLVGEPWRALPPACWALGTQQLSLSNTRRCVSLGVHLANLVSANTQLREKHGATSCKLVPHQHSAQPWMRAIMALYSLLQHFYYQKNHPNADHNASSATAVDNCAVLLVPSMVWLFRSCQRQCRNDGLGLCSWDMLCAPGRSPQMEGSRKCLHPLCAGGSKSCGAGEKLLAGMSLDLPPPGSSLVFKRHHLHRAN